MSWLKDNGGVLGVVTVAAVAVGGYAELRIQAAVPETVTKQVNDKLQAVHSVSPDKIDAIEGDISDLKDSNNRLDDKITRIVDILLEE